MIEIIAFLLILVIVYPIVMWLIKVVKSIYPYRWLILIAALGLVYIIHQNPSVKEYRRVEFTSCNNDSGRSIIKSHINNNVIRLKSGVNVNGICNVLADDIKIISDAYRTYSVPGYVVTITSAIDGKHVHNSQHYKGRAIDLRTRDISYLQASKIAKYLSYKLGDDYRVIWGDRNHRDHMHIAYIGYR